MALVFRLLVERDWKDIPELEFATRLRDYRAARDDAPKLAKRLEAALADDPGDELVVAQLSSMSTANAAAQDVALWVDWNVSDTPASATHTELRASVSAERERLARAIGCEAAFVAVPLRAHASGSALVSIGWGSPGLLTAGFKRFHKLNAMAARSTEELEAVLHSDSFTIGVHTYDNVLVTTSADGLDASFFGAIVQTYSTADAHTVRDKLVVVAVASMRESFNVEGLIGGLTQLLISELVPTYDESEERNVLRLQHLKRLLRVRYEFEQHLASQLEFLRLLQRAGPLSQAALGVIASYRVDIEHWTKTLDAHADRLQRAMEMSLAEQALLREQRELKRDSHFKRLENLVLPVLLWGTFWGMNFDFFTEVADTDGSKHLVLRIGSVEVPQVATAFLTLGLAFGLVALVKQLGRYLRQS